MATWVQAALQNWMPDLEGLLAPMIKGTTLLQGGPEDYLLALAIAIAFPIVRLFLDRTVYDWIGRKAIGLPPASAYKKSDSGPTTDQLDRLRKFKESLYKCGCQVLFTAVLLAVAVPKPWFSNTRLYWSGCFGLPCETLASAGERFVYCLEMGFYVQGIPMVLLWETRRKDTLELVAHHVATAILISYSYYLNLLHVGIMVLMCHEANDIFLELAKMGRYAQAPEAVNTGLFVVFVLSWFTTRIYAFAFHVLRSTMFESHERAAEINANVEPHFTILNSLLSFLYCLHVYWSYLIVRIVVRQLTHGELDDIRETEDGAEAAPATASAVKTARRRGAVRPRVLNPAGVASVGDMADNM